MKSNYQKDPALQFVEEQKKRRSPEYRYQAHLRRVRRDRIVRLCGDVVNFVACFLGTAVVVVGLLIMFVCAF